MGSPRGRKGALEMDMSINKADFVLGRKQIYTVDLQPEESLEIINSILRGVKPHFKYLSGFEPVDNKLNCRIHDHDSMETAEAVMEFPKGMDKKTRCLRIFQLSHNTEGKLTDSFNTEGRLVDCGRDFGVASYTVKELILSQKGELLEWLGKFNRLAIGGFGDQGNRTGIKEVAVACKFSLLADDDLLNILTCQGFIVWHLINALSRSIRQTIDERRTRLINIERLGSEFSDISARIAK
jgi:hypothetical protein